MNTTPKSDLFTEDNSTPKKLKQCFPWIGSETRSHVETACAAYWMNRKPQTLRAWASQENGPLRPTRVNGRLAWSVSAIRLIMNDGAV
jgi:hypothetical protein